MADSVYDQLRVPRAINAAGTLTRLGGSLMPIEVLEAMNAAARSFVRIDQLQFAVGRRIAELTGAEAGLVTCGAAAGVTLAAAACLAGDDFHKMDRLPDTSGMANEIVIARSHRNGYDHALRAAGARLVEVGVAERTRDPQAWEIEAAVNARTVAIAYCVGFSPLPLEMVVQVAHRNQVPVIVDASAALPPKANLRAFISTGADLVVFSGGKALRGPQASGILCGRRDLVASAALQAWDLDYPPALWNPPTGLIPADIVARGVPNHGIGRAMKVGKEEIVGLWAALERFEKLDEQKDINRMTDITTELVRGLTQAERVEIEVIQRAGLWPQIEMRFRDSTRLTAVEAARQLEQGDPPIHVMSGKAEQGCLGFDPFCLAAEEVPQVVRRVCAVLNR